MPASKPQSTQVRKAPFFDPHQGCWKFLPVGLTCQQSIQEADENGDVGQPVPVLESREKGLIPLRFATKEQAKLLPTNWRDIAYTPGGGISPKPVFADA